MALKRGTEKLFNFLRPLRAGTEVTEQQIRDACEWKPATFSTHWGKHKLDSFFAKTGPQTYRVLQDGASITGLIVDKAMSQVSPATSPPSPLQPGDELAGENDTYTLVTKLGNGAVGHVWSATSTKTSQLVACKIFSPREDLIDPKVLPNVSKRFSRESTNGRKLSHDALIHYLDVGENDGTPFLVMELAKESLANRIKAGWKPTIAEARAVVGRVCQAIEYLHAGKHIHRDVKPANILDTHRGIVLGDFGIVQWSDFNPAFTSANTITRNSIQLGSWYYMSPEQSQAPHDAVFASDVYALGVTWYELLTGGTPHPTAFAARRAPQPSKDPQTNDLIEKMTSYEAKDRPSVASLLAELK